MAAEAAPAGGPLVEARGLGVRFAGHPALEGDDLGIGAGEIVTVIGPNGSGKTTLVRALLGLIAPAAGTVRRRPGLRIGYVPQQLHVDETLPLTVRRFLRLGGARDAAALARALEEVGAPDVLDAPFQSLSGGEMRRVLLARALLRDPDLLVLDEPTAGVDVPGQAELYRVIRAIRTRRGCAVLLVSHDLHLVMAATDRVVCLNRHVCCQGRPAAVTRDPAYLALFGEEAGAALAVYTHRHDHRHGVSGEPLPTDAPPQGEGDGDG